MAYDDSIGIAIRNRRLADALRERQAAARARYRPSSATITTETGGRVPIVNVNYAGIINDALENYQQTKRDTEIEAADEQAAQSRRAAINDALASGDITPSKMLDLNEAGIDARLLKQMMPESNTLGANQIVQYGQFKEGMQAINKVQPGTFSEEEVAAAPSRYAPKGRASSGGGASGGTGGGGTGGSGTGASGGGSKPLTNAQLVTYGRTSAGMRAINKVQPGTFSEEEIAAAGDAKAAKTESAKDATGGNVFDKLMAYESRLSEILKSPESEDQLFSTSQSLVYPALANYGNVDSPTSSQAFAGQYAKTNRSPLAAELDRMNTDLALDAAAKLKPMSNTDIKLLLDQQVRAGDSRANMEQYLKTLRNLREKYKDAAVDLPADDVEDDDALYSQYLR